MSALPDTPDFRALLISLEVREDPAGILIPFNTDSKKYPGRPTSILKPKLYLCAQESACGKLSALQSKVRSALQFANHFHDETIVTAVLAVYATNRRLFPDELQFFNEMLTSIVEADVSHTVVFSQKRYEAPLWDYFGYHFSSIEDSPLKYRSQKANSNYYQIDYPILKTRACLTSPLFQRPVIAFLDLINKQAKATDRPISTLGSEMLLNYYEHLSQHYIDLMWDDLDERQLIPAAHNRAAIDTQGFRNGLGSASVTIYLNQSNEKWDGYVVPTTRGGIINIVDGESEVVTKALKIHHDKGANQPEIIRQFCHFGAQAYRAQHKQKYSDAFLSFFIAIELLLSSKENTTKSIARRSAVLTSPLSTSAFFKRQKEVESLYALRSQYVHAGKQPSEKDTSNLAELYSQILETVLSAFPNNGNPESDHSDWLKRLDFVASGYDANTLPSAEIIDQLALPVSQPESEK